MATAAELKEQVDQLQLQLKELSARKMVYSKDRKFPKLTREVDVTEWLQSIGDFVRNRFGDEKERVMFVMDHLEKEAKTEVRFRICLDKATLDDQSWGFTSRSTARVILGQVLRIATCGTRTHRGDSL